MEIKSNKELKNEIDRILQSTGNYAEANEKARILTEQVKTLINNNKGINEKDLEKDL